MMFEIDKNETQSNQLNNNDMQIDDNQYNEQSLQDFGENAISINPESDKLLLTNGTLIKTLIMTNDNYQHR